MHTTRVPVRGMDGPVCISFVGVISWVLGEMRYNDLCFAVVCLDLLYKVNSRISPLDAISR